jgi:predicted small secreted protein
MKKAILPIIITLLSSCLITGCTTVSSLSDIKDDTSTVTSSTIISNESDKPSTASKYISSIKKNVSEKLEISPNVKPSNTNKEDDNMSKSTQSSNAGGNKFVMPYIICDNQQEFNKALSTENVTAFYPSYLPSELKGLSLIQRDYYTKWAESTRSYGYSGYVYKSETAKTSKSNFASYDVQAIFKLVTNIETFIKKPCDLGDYPSKIADNRYKVVDSNVEIKGIKSIVYLVYLDGNINRAVCSYAKGGVTYLIGFNINSKSSEKLSYSISDDFKNQITNELIKTVKSMNVK